MAAQTKFGRLVGSAFAVSLAFGAIFAANAQSGWQSIDAGPTTSAPQAPSGGGWTAFDGIEFVRNKDAVATERMLAGLAILLETAVVEPGIKAVHGKRLQRDLGSVTEVRTWLLRLEEHAGSAQGADVALAKDLFGSLRKLVSEAVGNLDRGTDFGGLLSRLGSSDGPDIGSLLGRLGGSGGLASALGRVGGSDGLGSVFGPAMSQITQALQRGSWQGALAAVRRAVASMRQRRATRTARRTVTQPPAPPPSQPTTTARQVQPPAPAPAQPPAAAAPVPATAVASLPQPGDPRSLERKVHYLLIDEVNEDGLPEKLDGGSHGVAAVPFVRHGERLLFAPRFVASAGEGEAEARFGLHPGSGSVSINRITAVVEHRVHYSGGGRRGGFTRYGLVGTGGLTIAQPMTDTAETMTLASFQSVSRVLGVRLWKSDLKISRQGSGQTQVAYDGGSNQITAGGSANLGSDERHIAFDVYYLETGSSKGIGAPTLTSRRSPAYMFKTTLTVRSLGVLSAFAATEEKEEKIE